jgi:hypothetical protein
MRRVLFVHIPRTGGSTVEKLMRRHLRGVFSPSYAEGAFAGKGPRWLEQYDHYVGHNFYFSRVLLDPVFVFTILREPLDRLYSLWAFLNEHKPERAAEYEGFLDCVRRNPHFSNHQTRFLGSRYDLITAKERVRAGEMTRRELRRQIGALRRAPVGSEDLEAARSALGEMDFVGIFEDLEGSVMSLFRQWGVNIRPPLPQVRVSAPSTRHLVRLGDAERAEVEERNAIDIEVYKLALERYEEQRERRAADRAGRRRSWRRRPRDPQQGS